MGRVNMSQVSNFDENGAKNVATFHSEMSSHTARQPHWQKNHP